MLGSASFLVLTTFFASLLPLIAANPPLDFRDPNQVPILDFNDPFVDHTGEIEGSDLEFQLRQIYIHGVYEYQNVHQRLDVSPDTQVWLEEDYGATRGPQPKLRARSKSARIHRLADRSKEAVNMVLDAGRARGRPLDLPSSAWSVDDVEVPDVTDKETLLSLARIAANAYVEEPGTGDWIDIGSGFNSTEDFGWKSDGLRGHVYADTKNRTVVVGIKGTSPALFDGSETTTNDKLNDNLFFSCCCGQGGEITWRNVCSCQTEPGSCNSTCVLTALRKKNHYYAAAQDLYHNVTAQYPDAEIWLVGHSLGGAVSSLLAQTVGRIAVTFEAVPEAIAAHRLGLPTPPEYHLGADEIPPMNGVWHFGNDADPVFMGTCNTFYSSCSLAGYAMESKCHSGMRCVYNTTKELGWGQDIRHHQILNVIHQVVEHFDWVPKCKQVVNCTDCGSWTYFESNHSSTTTSATTKTTTSYQRTRTATCKTPGWWGCKDETTTETATSTTSTSSTSTCKTPGWFGCNDEVTTTTSTTTTSSTSESSTTTCETPGWFGCKDSTTITAESSSPSCKSSGWFGCKDAVSSRSTSRIPEKTATATCSSPGWFGCKDLTTTPANVHSAITSPPALMTFLR